MGAGAAGSLAWSPGVWVPVVFAGSWVAGAGGVDCLRDGNFSCGVAGGFDSCALDRRGWIGHERAGLVVFAARLPGVRL